MQHKSTHKKSRDLLCSCHGVKGEEYEVVISFGTLNGVIPNWDVIINGTQTEKDESAKKLLYVIASGAK